MQSRVIALGVSRSHRSSNPGVSVVPGGTVPPPPEAPAPDGVAGVPPLRFFGLGGPLVLDPPLPAPLVEAPPPSSALRFPLSLDSPAPGDVGDMAGTGLPARLPASGLVARLPVFSFCAPGGRGDVARFATTECPPRLSPRASDLAPGAGEPVREGFFDIGRGVDDLPFASSLEEGVCEPEREFDCCCCTAGSPAGCVCCSSSSSSSSSWYKESTLWTCTNKCKK